MSLITSDISLVTIVLFFVKNDFVKFQNLCFDTTLLHFLHTSLGTLFLILKHLLLSLDMHIFLLPFEKFQLEHQVWFRSTVEKLKSFIFKSSGKVFHCIFCISSSI